MDDRKYISDFVKTGNLNDGTQRCLEFHLNRFMDYLGDMRNEVEVIDAKDRWEILDL